MRFDDLAAKAARGASDMGRQAQPPPLPRLVEDRRRRALIAGWSTAVVGVLLVFGAVLLWPGGRPLSSPAGVVTTVTTAIIPSTGGSTLTPGVIEGARESCPVTSPGDSPFTPVSEAPDGPPASFEADWYGTPSLWTYVQRDGQDWTGLPTGADGSLTQKTFWWSRDRVPSEETDPDITVTATLLDGSNLTFEAGGPGTSGFNPEIGDFMLVGLEFPQAGCWSVTARYRDASLTYVAWVDGSDPS